MYSVTVYSGHVQGKYLGQKSTLRGDVLYHMYLWDQNAQCTYMYMLKLRLLTHYILFTYFPKLLKLRFLTHYILFTY